MLSKLKQRVESYRSGMNNIDLIPNKVSQEIHDHRWNICSTCDKLWKPTSSCKVCGCFMKIKTWMPNQRCPLDKWGPADEDKNGAG